MKNKFATPQRHIIRIGFSFHFLRAIKAAIKRRRANTFTEEMCKACLSLIHIYKGMKIAFGEAVLKEAHPNTAQLYLKGISGKTMELVGQSLGGGRINIAEIDGIETNFSGENPTLIVHNLDQPGHVSEVTSMLAHKGVNLSLIHI